MSQSNNPFAFGTQLYNVAETLLSRPTLPLVPTAPWDPGMTQAIEHAAAAENASSFVTAALHLLNDDLDNAHRLVQAQEGNQTADYLHMLVHRREGDWSNTGYWVRRTGPHPIYDALTPTAETGPAENATASYGGGWDPNAMVDRCRQADKGKPDTETATAVAALSAHEIITALGWCVRNTVSGTRSAK